MGTVVYGFRGPHMAIRTCPPTFNWIVAATPRFRCSPGWSCVPAKEQHQQGVVRHHRPAVAASAKKKGEWADVEELLKPQQGGTLIQWYPGHVAAAERELKRRLDAVDVVLEVRDGRCPVATAHPALPRWAGPQSVHVVLLNRADMVEPQDRRAWSLALEAAHDGNAPAVWTDGCHGDGTETVLRTLRLAAERVSARRARRGLRPRPVRAAVVGFPNVGKSALINRILRRRARESAARPGVTRELSWARAPATGSWAASESSDTAEPSDDIPAVDLLDTPGIIPPRLNDQAAAARLAACDDIGSAAYDVFHVAAALLDTLRTLPRAKTHLRALQRRYGIALRDGSPEDYLEALGQKSFNDEPQRAAERILRDFRDLKLGKICLELPVHSGALG